MSFNEQLAQTTLTLDTTLFWAYWEDPLKSPYVQKLLELQRHGQIEMVVTNRVHADIPDEPGASRLKEELDKLNVLEIGSVTRLGHWSLGVDKLPSERFLEVMSAIRARRPQAGKNKPADIRDWEHLHGHYLAGRDVFLTWDTGILDLGSDLCAELNLMVMKPEAFLANHLTIVSPERDDTASTNRE